MRLRSLICEHITRTGTFHLLLPPVIMHLQTEYQIIAPAAGRVKSIVDKGASVKEGDAIAEIEETGSN